jgi:hypothetical protein
MSPIAAELLQRSETTRFARPDTGGYLIDYLVGSREQRGRDGKIERLCSLEIDA